jgi:uncharacterized protein HemX
MTELLIAINVVVVLCFGVAGFAFWKAKQATEETRKIAEKLSNRFDVLEKRKGK